jgi:hypothetical protein
MDEESKKTKKKGMNRQECMECIKTLATSQGFYGRMYRHLKDLEGSAPEAYEKAMSALEDEKFEKPLDMVLYFET